MSHGLMLTISRGPTVQARVVAVLACLLAGWVLAQGLLFTDALLDWMVTQYGEAAKSRVLALQQMIEDGRDVADEEKLHRVNAFFNAVDYHSDAAQWAQKDYWATPFEVLGVNSADCEDYAISKYFTLLSMGIDEERMRITYVKSLTLDEAHMVLAYYPEADAEPLILDNLMSAISPASERTDLVPVYSFNGADLWLAVNRVDGQRVGGADRLKLWQAYQQRLMKQMAAK